MDTDFTKLYLENQLCFPLYAASRLTTQLYEPFLNDLDITYPQYLVLLVLWKESSKSVNEIGESLFLESNTLTPLLKRMEQKGLVERKRSSLDERKVLISLTSLGDSLKEKAATIPDKLLSSFAGSDPDYDALVAFREQLQSIVRLLNQKIGK